MKNRISKSWKKYTTDTLKHVHFLLNMLPVKFKFDLKIKKALHINWKKA